MLTVDSVNYIDNTSDGVNIAGTGGRDYITNSGERVTLRGGEGNDTFEGSSFAEMYLFSSADDDNVIVNFGAGDSLKMTAGKTMTWSTIGSDVTVTLKGAKYTSTITLLDAADYIFKKSGNVLTVQSIGSSAELPSEDYWFEQDVADDPIGEIIASESAIDLNFDQLSEMFEHKIELTRSARDWKKKQSQ